MAYKRLEENTFTWPAVRDGVMTLNRAQFEALFAPSRQIAAQSPAGQWDRDWRRVRALDTRRPAAAE